MGTLTPVNAPTSSASFLQQPSYDGNSQFAKEVDFGNDADGFGAEGQKEEGGSVVAALKMISDDIQKDITKAQEEEDASQKSYDEFVSETDAAISANEDEITRLQGEISTQEGVKTDNAEGKQADQKQLGLDQEVQSTLFCPQRINFIPLFAILSENTIAI